MKPRSFGLLIMAIGMLPCTLAAQARGTVTGRILSTSTGEPLFGVQVVVGGTTLGAITNQDGRYLIANVPVGPREIRASVIGFARGVQEVGVLAATTVSADFALAPSAVLLEGVIATATGQELRRREIGSAVANIGVADLDLAPVTTMSQLLQARAPGVIVNQSSGTTGGGSKIRIRGTNSISLSNTPMLLIDGVRVYNAESSIGFAVGGQAPSRLDDLNPEDIESIEILRGPSAAALYGTAAANGVIQVTTKRGRTSAARFDLWSEYGRIDRNFRFPENVTRLDAVEPQFKCSLVVQNTGICQPQAVTHRANPLENPETTPFGNGERRVMGASVSGGGQEATFYLSGEYETEDGIYLDHNTLDRVRVQANLTGNPGPSLSVGARVGYMDSGLELPQADNALFGIIGMGMFGDSDPSTIQNTGGYENDPGFHDEWRTFQDLSRVTGSVDANYRPSSWLSATALVGMDRISRTDINRIPRETVYGVYGGVYTNGFIQNNGYDIANYTANASVAGTFALPRGIEATTTTGIQYAREESNLIYAFGAGLSPGSETSLAGATTDFEANETNVSDALFGAYLQQQLAWRDRRFVNISLRGDRSSTFGTDYGWAWYPSVSASWVITEEPIVERFVQRFGFLDGMLDSFRLRAAYGQSGLRPGTTTALLYFSPTITTFAASDVPAFTIGGMGNPELRPERSSEVEFGFEAGFRERVGLTVTYYSKTSTDALVSVPIAPSAGGTTRRWENLAEVRNDGLELMLEGTALRTRPVDLTLNLSGSFLRNRLVELGSDGSGESLEPIVLGEQRHARGYPLGGYWMKPITGWTETNGGVRLGDARIGEEEVFFGNSMPTREFSLGVNATVFGVVRLSTLFEHRGGHKLLNLSRAWRETFEENDQRTYEATPAEQAGQVALLDSENRTYAAYIEDAGFVKWREAAITVSLPERFARRIRARGLSLTLAGRNLATWTDYSGLDPELNYAGQANFTSADFATLPPSRLMTLRIDANF